MRPIAWGSILLTALVWALPSPQVANYAEEWYNVSTSAREINPQGVPYGFAPRAAPGRCPRHVAQNTPQDSPDQHPLSRPCLVRVA